MTEQSEHLSSAQIENYGKRSSGAGPESARRGERPRAPDQRINDQRINDQGTHDQRLVDQQANDRQSDDRQSDDRESDDQRIDDQRINDQRINDEKVDDERVATHLADCPSCRNRLLEFHRTRFALLAGPAQADATSSGPGLADSKSGDERLTGSALADSKFANSKYPADPQVRTAFTPECPSDDALRQLAAGLSSDDTAPGDALATKLTQHAATCDHCGPLLKTYTEDFSDDFSPEEQAALADLQSSSAAWQKNAAQKMLEAGGVQAGRSVKAAGVSGSQSTASAVLTTDGLPSLRKSSARPTVERKPFFWKWVLVPATAAIVAITAFSIWYTQRDTPEKVEKLLAQAYTENRNMEMRVPYAKHSDYHQERGDAGSLLNLPDSYRDASVPITSNLKKHPDDPTWLLLSARFDLLHWDYKSALSTLERIDDPKVIESSEARLTRALALYEKAEAESPQRDQMYAEIVELMGKSLQKNPDDPAALFNHAIACEKSHMYECAITDYKHLLNIEKDDGWANEAEKNLSRIEEKKKTEP